MFQKEQVPKFGYSKIKTSSNDLGELLLICFYLECSINSNKIPDDVVLTIGTRLVIGVWGSRTLYRILRGYGIWNIMWLRF